MPDILVLGGGFAGIWAALTAARENIVNAGGLSVALVTRDPFLTVRPRLYEAGPEHLRAPLLPVLEPVDVALVTGQAERIDPQARTVTLIGTDGRSSAIPWCRLIVATGSIAAMPPIHGLETHGFTIDDHKATMKLDVHMRRLLETPESGSALTFAILGAGFTGIELACEMRDRIAVHAGEQRAQDARIVLLEKADVAGPELGPGPRGEILQALAQARIELRTGARITEVQADRIIFADEDSPETQTVIATTGQIASVPAGLEAAAHGAGARIAVCDDLRIAAFPDIYAAGDTALAQIDDSGRHAPMSCQHAMPMGRFAGYNAAHDLLSLTTLPYRQERYVTCLDLGRSGAVFTRGWDRTVDMTGDEAASLKRAINTQWIYPPQGSREDIIAASDIAHAIRR